MNCEEVRELAGAYVLGALEGEEVAAFEAHIAGCSEHGDLPGLETVAAALALGTEEREPPAGLGARIRAAVAAEVAGPGARNRAERRRWRWVRWGSIAAAVAVVVGLLAWNVALQLDDDGPEYVHTYRGRDSIWMRLQARMSESPVTVEVSGLERLEEGRVYRLWAIRDGVWIAVGEFNTNADGWWRGEFEFGVEWGDVLSVTVEPAGSEGRPTGEPLFRTEL